MMTLLLKIISAVWIIFSAVRRWHAGLVANLSYHAALLSAYAKVYRKRRIHLEGHQWNLDGKRFTIMCPVCSKWFDPREPVGSNGDLFEPMHCPGCHFEANINLKGWKP